MPPQHPVWLDYATGFGPLLAVVVAVIVAVMQYCLQKQQQRQDLYDKRYVVFMSVRLYVHQLLEMLNTNKPHAPDRGLPDNDGAYFLFGADVGNYLAKLQDDGCTFCNLVLQHRRFTDSLTEDSPAELYHKNAVEMRVIMDLARKLEEPHEMIMAFDPYLSVGHELAWHQQIMLYMDRAFERADALMKYRYSDKKG